jgi:uncharacterized LabA/DUF88 family protein
MADTTTLLSREREWMLFVDGENLTKRGQETLKTAGVQLRAGPHWRKDVYLWLPGQEASYAFFSRHGGQFLNQEWRGPRIRSATRAYYYTSTTSDQPEWTETRLALRAMGFEPRLFRRAGGRSKAVDVALTTDVLTLASEGRYEVAVIFAGDGDYVPLIEAVKRIGLHVVVGFFEENGLSPELRIAADQYVDLTRYFVRDWKQEKETREREEAKEGQKAPEAEEADEAITDG